MIDPSKPFDLTHIVDEAQSGQRLDIYVHDRVPTISRTRIKAYNAEGRVLVNGVVRPDSWKVRTGDTVVLKCHIPEGALEAAARIPLDIVQEDDDYAAVNKQSGLVVHPVALHRHDTLLNALFHRYKDLLGPEGEIALGNRIDKLTSGLVLVSKHAQAKRGLQQQFEGRTVLKEYAAIVCGCVADEEGVVDSPIGPKKNRANRCLMDIRDDEEGRPSLTSWHVLERFDAYTLVACQPKTGRQHQIRVHMRSIGHPLLGDHLYGDGMGVRATASDGREVILDRFALHAKSVWLKHPVSGEPLEVHAPLAEDMAAMLVALREGWELESFPLSAASALGDEVDEEVSTQEVWDSYWSRTSEFDIL